MKFYEKLYVSENIKNKEEIVTLLSNKIDVLGVYVICVLLESKNLFEIFESKYLFNNFNKNKDWIIVGLSNSKEDSKKLLEIIFKENFCYNVLDFKKKFF